MEFVLLSALQMSQKGLGGQLWYYKRNTLIFAYWFLLTGSPIYPQNKESYVILAWLLHCDKGKM